MSPRTATDKDAKQKIDELWKTKEWMSFGNLLRKVPLNPITNPLSSMEEHPSIKTNTVLDDLFAGGLRKGQLIELYGTYGSGKTQTCFTLVCESKIGRASCRERV